ncbi:MAG: type IV pilus assembly protein PilM [Candidatus Sumerlaeia bacterium]|nr:type IV pilus assembly protein PilM [Candidatus Sumerlaeia bacterium]
MFGSKAVVGLDIGSNKVKAVQIRRKGQKFELERLGVAEIFPDGNRDVPSLQQARTNAVKRVLEEGKFTAKYCVISVNGESIIVRYIQLPKMPEDELKNALRWEAEEYIPYALDEVNIDSVILGAAGDNKVDVLLVCAKKELLAEYIQIVRDVNLTPLVVDVDSFAFLNCFELTYNPTPQDCIALVNIGAQTTNINIYSRGTSRFSRDISIAGDTITNAICQKTGLDYKRAEEIKLLMGAPVADEKESTEEEESSLISSIRGTVERMTGTDLVDESLDANATKAIKNVMTNLAGEIRRSIQFFENQSGGLIVSKVILGGGSSRMNNITTYLSRELEVEVQLFDPLRSVQAASNIDISLLQTYKEHLSVSLGLALRKAG